MHIYYVSYNIKCRYIQYNVSYIYNEEVSQNTYLFLQENIILKCGIAKEYCIVVFLYFSHITKKYFCFIGITPAIHRIFIDIS